MRLRLIFIILCFVMVADCAFAEGKRRRWTDIQGRKLEATLTGFSNGLVSLKLDNGQTYEIPIDRLRERDRAIVRRNAPIDLKSASIQIDKIVLEGLKRAHAEIKEQQASLEAKEDLDPAERNKERARLRHMEKLTHPTKPLSDEVFLRRVYLDIAGRIPTYEEARRFLRSPQPNKRNALIDALLDSEAFVSHFFNYLSDLLRIRDGISMSGFPNLKSGAYADWVKDQIRRDRPWDEFVSELLSASGYFWENPATGYLLTDYGMELCNLSNTFTTFTGTEITCAQCHNHPFEEVYQIDFYRMAAFFGSLSFEASPNEPVLLALAQKKKEFAAEAKKKKQNINDLNGLLSAYNLRLTDKRENRTKLPFDYQYDNANPEEKVEPGVYFGDMVKVEQAGGPRKAFGAWMTSKSNPRFTINIVNRLWKYVFGAAQIEPVDNIPGHLDDQAQNYELLVFLENLMKEADYSIKDFLRVLYKTGIYQREACYRSPTLQMIDRGEFHFSAPLLRRISAEQLWDSLVAMSVPDPEASELRRRVLEQYREVMEVDWMTMSYEDARAWRARYLQAGKPSEVLANSQKQIAMVRASELPLPYSAGSLLYSFGQSDKKFIENGSKDGAIPQVMRMLNGTLTNKIMSDPKREMVRLAQAEKSPDAGSDVLFLSVLTRRPLPQEREFAENLIRGGGKDGKTDYSDLIWALLNTREFLFIR